LQESITAPRFLAAQRAGSGIRVRRAFIAILAGIAHAIAARFFLQTVCTTAIAARSIAVIAGFVRRNHSVAAAGQVLATDLFVRDGRVAEVSRWALAERATAQIVRKVEVCASGGTDERRYYEP